jgi:hypothetical protein
LIAFSCGHENPKCVRTGEGVFLKH